MPRVLALSAEIPAAVRALHGHAAVILKTYGADAACAIHSVYGESRGGFIRMDRPRQFLRDAFGETAAEFAGRVQDPNVVEDVAGVLWQDLLKPCVHRAVHGDGPVRLEGEAVWRELMARNPLVAQQLLAAFVSDDDAYQNFWQKRMVVVQRFASVCRCGSLRTCFVEPLLVSLGLQDEFNMPCEGVPGCSKLDVLFTDRPEAEPLYQSIMESVGVRHLGDVTRVVESVVGSWDASDGDTNIEAIFKLSESVTDAMNSYCETKPFPIDDFFGVLYPAYLAALAAPASSYFLSDLELIALAKCTRTNVAVFKHIVATGELVYQRGHVTDAAGPMILTAVQVHADANEVRSHFERFQTVLLPPPQPHPDRKRPRLGTAGTSARILQPVCSFPSSSKRFALP